MTTSSAPPRRPRGSGRLVRLRPVRLLAAAALAAPVLAVPATALAQGSLSTQGFGYPPGELSTRARSTGGAAADFDALSAPNPAALGYAGPNALYLQYEPELRSVRLGGADNGTTTLRFPLFGALFRAGERVNLGVTASTFLDRTWATRDTGTRIIAGQPILSTQTFRADGAMTDLRLGGAYVVRPWLVTGLALHAITGHNRATVQVTFSDSSTQGFRQDSTFDFSGSAASGGVVLRAGRWASLAVSGRKGGRLTARSSDKIVSRADVPDRYGVSLRSDALPGASVFARADWVKWSALNGLGSDEASARDGWDAGVGAELVATRAGEDQAVFRAGARFRTLPFEINGETVREASLAGGAGLPLARGRVLADVGIERAARRSSGLSVRERAWLVSIGLTVRP